LIDQKKNFLIALRTSVHWDTVAGDLVSRQPGRIVVEVTGEIGGEAEACRCRAPRTAMKPVRSSKPSTARPRSRPLSRARARMAAAAEWVADNAD
jgi:hypothetical protein